MRQVPSRHEQEIRKIVGSVGVRSAGQRIAHTFRPLYVIRLWAPLFRLNAPCDASCTDKFSATLLVYLGRLRACSLARVQTTTSRETVFADLSFTDGTLEPNAIPPAPSQGFGGNTKHLGKRCRIQQRRSWGWPGIPSGTARAKALILPHEFAHIAGVFDFASPDDSMTAPSQNTAKIIGKCCNLEFEQL